VVVSKPATKNSTKTLLVDMKNLVDLNIVT
jgi:hypothetical protein